MGHVFLNNGGSVRKVEHLTASDEVGSGSVRYLNLDTKKSVKALNVSLSFNSFAGGAVRPYDIGIEGSNDNTNWETIISETGNVPANQTLRTILAKSNLEVAYRYYRCRTYTSYSGWSGIGFSVIVAKS